MLVMLVYLNSDPNMKFTVNAVIKFAGKKITIEVVYFNQQHNRFEYPKFAPQLLTLVEKSA